MKRLAALEGLRGYAAFLVFLVHSSGLVAAHLYGVDADSTSSLQQQPPAVAALIFFFRSHYGVDLFFVLSGLLMADIAARRWPGTRAFLGRRALRVYPAYLASGAAALLAGAWLFDRTVTMGDVAGNAAFLQGFFLLGIAPVNPVTWSLSYEAAFYAAVPLLALAWGRRRASSPEGGAAWMLAGAFAAIIVAASALPGHNTIYFSYFALFVPGMWLGMMDGPAREAAARRLPTALALFAWIAFALAFKLELLHNTAPAYYVASAIACGMLVLKACDGACLPARLLTARPALALGRISYSFFLMHYVVLHVLGYVAMRAIGVEHRAAYAAAIYAGGFVLSIAAAWALYQVAERFYFEARRPRAQ